MPFKTSPTPIAVLTVALMLAGCARSTPASTSLAVLSEAQRDFNGREVVVSGTLRSFDMPRHYWIENASFDRVALDGVDNPDIWLGQLIRVRGTFFYDAETGRRILVEEISASP